MPSSPARIIGAFGGYRRTLSFLWTCLVYHATEVFCARNYSFHNDALGKTVGQMMGAARSARQNIVEGSSCAGTSKETELRLYDVAKGSLQELAGDYEAFLVGRGELPWADDDPRAVRLAALGLRRYAGPLSRHDFATHLIAERNRFAEFLEAEDPVEAANAILFAIDQACALLHRQMETVGETFREEGGFTERMTAVRLAARDAQVAESGVPPCPKCGKPMRKIVARKGRNAGSPFWSCTGYPDCNGTRNFLPGGGW